MTGSEVRKNDGFDDLTEKTMIQRLRDDFLSCLSVVDNDVKNLIASEKEMRALVVFGEAATRMKQIHETVSSMYQLYCDCEGILRHFDSKRLSMLGHELLPTVSSLFESSKVEGVTSKQVEAYYWTKLREIGGEYEVTHWYFKSIFLNEVFYMLDCLEILIEHDFIPGNDETDDISVDRNDRYFPPQVKISVWRRDEGKCVKCGSQEKLEYDHIIPVSKGGSNTERNIQLLCEKCNRSKGAVIGD